MSDRKSFLMAFFIIGLVDGDRTVCVAVIEGIC